MSLLSRWSTCARLVLLDEVRPQAVAQLAHRAGGGDAVPGDVADHADDGTRGELHDVVPVAAHVPAHRRAVVGGQGPARDLRQLVGEQAALQGGGGRGQAQGPRVEGVEQVVPQVAGHLDVERCPGLAAPADDLLPALEGLAGADPDACRPRAPRSPGCGGHRPSPPSARAPGGTTRRADARTAAGRGRRRRRPGQPRAPAGRPGPGPAGARRGRWWRRGRPARAPPRDVARPRPRTRGPPARPWRPRVHQRSRSVCPSVSAKAAGLLSSSTAAESAARLARAVATCRDAARAFAFQQSQRERLAEELRRGSHLVRRAVGPGVVVAGDQAPQLATVQERDGHGRETPHVPEVLDVHRRDAAEGRVAEVERPSGERVRGRDERRGAVADVRDQPEPVLAVQRPRLRRDVGGGVAQAEEAVEAERLLLLDDLPVPLPVEAVDHHPVEAGQAAHLLDGDPVEVLASRWPGGSARPPYA